MFRKLLSFFKKNEEVERSGEEYLDFSDYTDVHLENTRRIGPTELPPKPAKGVSNVAKPTIENKKDKVEKEEKPSEVFGDETIIPEINTKIRNELKKDELYDEEDDDSPIHHTNETSISSILKRDGLKEDTQTEKEFDLPEKHPKTSPINPRKNIDFDRTENATDVRAIFDKSSKDSFFKKLLRLIGKKEDDAGFDKTKVLHKQLGGEDKTIFGSHETVKMKVGSGKKGLQGQNVFRLVSMGLIAVLLIIIAYDYIAPGDEELPTAPVVKKVLPKKRKIEKEKTADKLVEKRRETDEKKKDPPKKEKPRIVDKSLEENIEKRNKNTPPTTIMKKREFERKQVAEEKNSDLEREIGEPQPSASSRVQVQKEVEEPVVRTRKVDPKPAFSQNDFPDEEGKKFEENNQFENTNVLSEEDLIAIENEIANEENVDSINDLTDLSVNYLASGAGLVYNCVGKHWACVNKINFIKCRKVSGFNPKRCHSDKFFTTKRSCQVQQIKNINGNASTSFCY